MQLQSEPKHIAAPNAAVYAFLTDFHHFEHLLPEQVKQWEAETERCSFTIEGLPQIKLRLGSLKPDTQVEYLPDGDSPVNFSLQFVMDAAAETETLCKVQLEADLNPMLSMMAKRPLQNFVDLVAGKLKAHLDGLSVD
jgi:carbon monoxide dehydrogenase subunit G